MPGSLKNSISEEIWSATDQIDFCAWEQVRGPSDIFLDRRLLKALEASMSDVTRFQYVLYRDASDKPIAIAVLCTFTIDVGVLVNDEWTRWVLNGLRKISNQLGNYRIVFCGLPLSAAQSSLRFVPGADTSAIITRLDKTLLRMAKQDRAKLIVLKEFQDQELPSLRPLEALGYRKADSLPTHLISLKITSFDDYLGSLSRSSRHSIKRSLRKFAASGLEFVTTSDFQTIERLFTPEVHQYYESVFERSKTKFEHLPRVFFLEMARNLPDCCEFTFALDRDRVRGFCISLFCEQEYWALYLGFDLSINADSHLYFNLSLRGIADAIRHNVSIAEIGQNADEVKRSKFGAVPSRRSIYVRGTSRFMNCIISVFFNQLFPARDSADAVPSPD